MISVIIRNKNQEFALEFLLRNLTERYINDIEEIIVIDNLSTDSSEAVSRKYNFYLDYNLSNIILKKNFTKLTCLETLVGSFSNL